MLGIASNIRCMYDTVNQNMLENKFLPTILAETFMAFLEQKMFFKKRSLFINVLFWNKYVTDLLPVWIRTQRQVENILTFLNSF